MARSKTSKKWLHEHFKDQYVKQAWKDGLRSRAAYKLLEIQEKDRFIRPGMSVVDLGAAPGGWTQVLSDMVGGKGRIMATDILLMDPFPDVTFIQGDFTEQAVFDQLMAALGSEPVDVVMSDMAPNMSGHRSVDQARAMCLVELAVDFAAQALKPGGDLLMKVFQGEGFEALHKSLRQQYKTVLTRKPGASRGRSREIYLLARQFIGN